MTLSTAARDRQADAFGASLDGGSLVLLSGLPPAVPDDPLDTQRVIAVLPLAYVVRAAGGRGVLDTGAGQIVMSGWIGWAQLRDAAGDVVATLTVGEPGDDERADMVLTTRNAVEGEVLRTVNAPSFSQPAESLQ